MKRKKRIAVVAPVLFGFASLAPTLQAETPKDLFEAPVVLKAGKSVLNLDGKLMYASPAGFDVDNDGKDELVIGTIFGAIVSCENENTGSGDPKWSEPKPVESTDGEPLELNNW